jgi:hypothetical protein
VALVARKPAGGGPAGREGDGPVGGFGLGPKYYEQAGATPGN